MKRLAEWRAHRAALLLLLLLVLLPSWAAHAESVVEYRAALAQALALAESATDADEAERAGVVAAITHLLDAISTVDVGGQPPLALVNPPLRAALADGDLARVRANLAALLAALDAVETSNAPSATARDSLAAILARPEFRPRAPAPWETWLSPVREAWERLVRTVLYHLGATGGSGESSLLVGVGVLVLLGLVALLLGAVGGQVVAAAQIAVPPPGARPRARATREQARRLAEAGRYRDAVHELYAATLLHLDERGLLRFRPSLTNREHLVRGAASPALAPLLAPLVEGYDRLWYSGAPCTADDWTGFAALSEAVWRTA